VTLTSMPKYEETKLEEIKSDIDPLAIIEGTHAIADLMDGMRSTLVDRGWSAHTAEIAAIEFYRMERSR
jgi:hypothetical protein